MIEIQRDPDDRTARHREEGTDASWRKALTLIFDFDGTIADTLAAIVRLADKYNEDLGIPPSIERRSRPCATSSREILRRHRIPLAKLPHLLLHHQKELGREIDKLGLFPGIRGGSPGA